jgi:adenosylcobinamide-phosphate synthase
MSHNVLDILITFSSIFLLWGAVIVNVILPLDFSSHPARLWRQFAHLLAEKVNTNHSYTQDMISGTLACALMLLPALTVLMALGNLAGQIEYFNIALLIIALDWRHQLRFTNQMVQLLGQEDKANARLALSPIINRQVDTLSMVGLGKATVETLVVGQTRQVIGVMFWFAVGGGIGALIYRLACELQRAWSPAKPDFRPFGLASSRLVLILEWLPSHLFILLLLIGRNVGQIYSQAKTQVSRWPSPSTGWLLSVIGLKLQLALGGPAIYESKKAVRAKLGGRIAPSALHISQVATLINQRTLWWIVIQSILMVLTTLVTHV